MAKYRILVRIDELNVFWIVVDRERFIRNPTKENLKDAQYKYYNKTNICPRCRKECTITDKSILYPKNARREKDKYGKETGGWICKIHAKRDYERNDPNSSVNTIKLMRKRRMANLDQTSNQAKGDKFERLSEIYLGVDNLNVKYDNYEYPIDHSPIPNGTFVNIGGELVDLSGKIPQTRGRYYNQIYEQWQPFGNFEREWYKEFDIIIFWCASTDGKTIERTYIIPKKEIYDSEIGKGRKNITIIKNSSRGKGWYERYRIADEAELRKIDEIWKNIQ